MRSRKPRSSSTGRVTMADIAKLAGVSTITVSRAFKKPDLVTEELRKRIFGHAQELGYVPNRVASALAGAPSMNVVILIPSMTNMVFVEMLAGIHEVLYPRGYQMLIGVTRYSPLEEERLLQTYLEFLPDGLLLTGTDHLPTTWSRLESLNRPTVHMMENESREGYPCVGFSQFDGGYTMAKHLVDRGYRRIAFVAAQLDPRTLARAEGYRQALRDAGLYDPKRELMVPEPSSISMGANLLDRLLTDVPDSDAVFFCNDDLAQGALFQCHRRKIDVPKQLAITGFNDLPASAWTSPMLTTIATPRYQIGRHAANTLLTLLEGKEPETSVTDLGFTLMARESS